MNPTLYGNKETTEPLKKAFATTATYQKQKLATIMRFFGILAAHPEARVCALADTINDPEMDRDTFRFFVLVRGVKSPAKLYVINSAMTIFAVNLTMINKNNESVLDLTKMTPEQKAAIQYQPSSFATFYKHVFAHMKNEGVAFEQANFSGIEGTSLSLIYFHYFFQILTPSPLYSLQHRLFQSSYQGKV